MVWTRLSRWIGLALVMCLISACTGSGAATLPDAREALNKASQEIQSAKSLKIKLQVTGAPAFVDPPTNTIAFISADGSYAAPDRVRARIIAKIFGIAGEIEIVTIGDDQWYSNKILTGGKFIKQAFAPGFNAAKLVSSETGIESALAKIRDLKMIGAETLDGIPVYHITGVADGKDIEALTVGLIRGQVVNADIYLNRDTSRVERVVLVQPDTVTEKEPKPTTWILETFDYNTNIQIDAPQVDSPTAAPVTPTVESPATATVDPAVTASPAGTATP
jgi:hypothetical protein